MIVSEIFGPTLQGEGPNAGRRAVFLRLGGCNLACSWCDTPYTWDASRFDLRAELTEMDVEAVTTQLVTTGCDRLIITGGEPLLQDKRLIPLLEEIAYATPHVEIETNGTLLPSDDLLSHIEQLNVSPKLEHAGNGAKAIRLQSLRALQRTGKAVFKFVVQHRDDLTEVDSIVAACGMKDVWLMPEGTTPAAVIEKLGWLCDAAIERGYSVSSRLHILAWGDERGR